MSFRVRPLGGDTLLGEANIASVDQLKYLANQGQLELKIFY